LSFSLTCYRMWKWWIRSELPLFDLELTDWRRTKAITDAGNEMRKRAAGDNA
jgi:hypothetical protein